MDPLLPLRWLVRLFLGWVEDRAMRRELAILGLLADGQWWYGLDLVNASNGMLSRGSIYTYLERLEARACIVSRQEAFTPAYIGIPRRQYRIAILGGAA